MLTSPSAVASRPSAPTSRATSTQTRDTSAPDGLRVLRYAIWLYIVLWIFEGALRKWIMPSMANPLLVVRDPVLLFIYFMALTKNVFPKNVFVAMFAFEGVVALVASIASTTDIPLMVQLFGFRANFLHLPLIFVIPNVFTRADVRRVGLFLLAVAMPMSALVFLQFRSDRLAWVNTGAGGTGGMLGSALAHIRPSGTFSFGNGLGGFTILVAAFFLWQIFSPKLFPRLLWLASSGALVTMIALSGSRSTAGAVALVCAGVLLVGIVQPRYWPAAIKLLVLVGVGGFLIVSVGVFKEGLNVFAERFGDSNNVQHGFVDRYFSSFYEPFLAVENAKPLGVGLGMGTNAASGILNDGKRTFMLVEGDIGRVILESGPVIGITYELTRALLAFYLFTQAMGSLYRRANPLPILIFCGIFSSMIQGNFAQPTELGFVVIAAGLCLTAVNFPPPGENPSERTDEEPLAAATPTPARVIRGRSLYAEQLHRPGSESDGE